MQVAVLNGVNLSMLGKRDPAQYGTTTLTQLETMIYDWAKELNMSVRCWHTNSEGAYVDMLDMRSQVPFGIMRELHRWAAHAMVIMVMVHMFRVFMTGSYKPPREFNWVIGVLLLVLTFLLSFTGYLLPWDQLAIWAITVGSNMAKATPMVGAGGPFADFLQIGGVPLVHPGDDARFMLLGAKEIGGTTLLLFYVLHCIGIPLIAAVLMAVHFWRIRKDGGISGPL